MEAHAEELGESLSDEEKAAAEDAAQSFLDANDSKILHGYVCGQGTVAHVLELMALQQKVYGNPGTDH